MMRKAGVGSVAILCLVLLGAAGFLLVGTGSEGSAGGGTGENLTGPSATPGTVTSMPGAGEMTSETGNAEETVRCEPQDSRCLVSAMQAEAAKLGAGALAVWNRYVERHPEAKMYCHAVFHAIGQAEGRRTTNVWRSMAMGDAGCNNGFHHGVVEGYTEAMTVEEIVAQEQELCRPEEGGRYLDEVVAQNCFHGLGHALMAKTSGSWEVPIEACGRLEGTQDRVTCTDGVWMQWSDDAAENRNFDAGVEQCLRAPGFAQQACVVYAPRIEWERREGDGVAVMRSCGTPKEPAQRELCAEGVGKVAAVMVRENVEKVLQVCRTVNGLSEECAFGYLLTLRGLVDQGAVKASTYDRMLAGLTVNERAGVEALLNQRGQ